MKNSESSVNPASRSVSSLASRIFRTCGIVFLAASGRCMAEEPYIAKGLSEVFELRPDGSKQLVQSLKIIEARSRDGSRYTAQERPTGKLIILWQKSSGLLYQIDTTSKKAVLIDKSYDLMAGPRSAPENQDSSVQTSLIGEPCVRLPVRQGSAGKLTKAGENCVSYDLGLILKSEAAIKVDDKMIVTTRTISEIRKGVEPESVWFVIPDDYTVIDRQSQRR